MIGLVDLKKSINELLKNTGVKTIDNSEKEGFKRPCFFVQILPIKVELLKTYTTENKYMVDINYFSAEKTQLANLEMSDTLSKKILPFINIKDRKLVPKNIESEENDGILSFKFNLEWLDHLDNDKEEYSLMEELDIKNN